LEDLCADGERILKSIAKKYVRFIWLRTWIVSGSCEHGTERQSP
jgi:hypothetical protein